MSAGRPRSLTAEQEQRAYAEIPALRYGQRHKALSQLAREWRVSVSTVERGIARQRRAHLERIAETFHKLPQNSSEPVRE